MTTPRSTKGQLPLFSDPDEVPALEPHPWRLSPWTRWVGKVGVIAARTALAEGKRAA